MQNSLAILNESLERLQRSRCGQTRGARWQQCAAAVGLLACLGFAPGARADTWQFLGKEDGVALWERTYPDSAFFEFRGRVQVPASIDVLTAVILDSGNTQTASPACHTCIVIENLGPGSFITYHRTRSPTALVDDRDVVTKVTLIMLPHRNSVRIEFRSIDDPRYPPQRGVVRIPQLSGAWQLEQVDAGQTVVTYEVAADPGGSLPGWLTRWASRDLPRRTLGRVREHVIKFGAAYSLAELRRSLDWSGFALPEVAERDTQASRPQVE